MPNPLPVARPVLSSRSAGAGVPAAPPLWVWLATGAGTLLGLLGLLVMAYWSERQLSRRFTQDAEQLLRREWTQRTDSVTRVVVLGSSLVEYGVADPDFFARRCSGRVRVVRLFREGVNLDAYTAESPVFALLERYPPDVLCIEENLLLFRLQHLFRPDLDANLAETINRHVRLRIKALKTQRSGSKPKPQDALFAEFPPEQRGPNGEDTLHLTRALSDIRGRTVRTEAELLAVYASCQRLRQRGTRCVLLHIPRPAALERVIHGEDRAPRLRRLIDQSVQRHQLDYWRFTRPLPFRYFADYAHLNHLGNPIYSAWLADQLCPFRIRSRRAP